MKDRKKIIINDVTHKGKSLIGINKGQGIKKKEKREERQFPHERLLVVESIIDLDKIREIIAEKRYYHEYNTIQYNITIWSNVYKQYHVLKRKPTKIKSLQLYEGFQLQHEEERADKQKKQKENLFQNVNEISEGREHNTISLALSRKEDEDILYDKYSMKKEPQKRENEPKEGEINSEAEMGEVSEGNEVGEVEIDERVNEKKEQDFISEKKSSPDIFSDKIVSSLGRKLEKQYSIDYGQEKHMTREEGCTFSESENSHSHSDIEKS